MSDSKRSSNSVTFTVGTPLERVEQGMILKTLEHTNDDKQQAARLLGISVKTLQRKLRQYSLPAATPERLSPWEQ